MSSNVTISFTVSALNLYRRSPTRTAKTAAVATTTTVITIYDEVGSLQYEH